MTDNFDEFDDFKAMMIDERTDRIKLPLFLDKYGDYETLVKLLKKMEIEQTGLLSQSINNYIEYLFLGMIGAEHNRQYAIYELPTKELIYAITIICSILEINNIEELMAGQGLLSKVLDIYCSSNNLDISIRATDGKIWSQTIGASYYPINKKYVIDYALPDNVMIDKDTLYVISHIPETNHQELIYFLREKKPNYLLLINQYDIKNKLCRDIVNENYTIYTTALKQICYRDYYRLYDENKNENENISTERPTSHSSIQLFINGNINNAVQLHDLLESQFIEANCIASCSALDIYNDPTSLKYHNACVIDLIAMNILPKWILNMTIEEQKTLLVASVDIEGIFPKYINNYDDYMFYAKQYKENRYPKKINTYDKFLEYKKLYVKLENNELVNMKTALIFPAWLHSNAEAYKYLYTDYSTVDKKWKRNRNAFTRQFTLLASM